MKKRKGSLREVAETVSTPQPAERRRKTRASAGGIVAMTVRLSWEAWREVHDMALSEGISVNTLITDALNLYREKRGLDPLKPVPTKTTT